MSLICLNKKTSVRTKTEDKTQGKDVQGDANGYHVPVPLKNAKPMTMNVKITLK